MNSSTEYISAKKAEIVAVATKMLEGTLNLIEGSRKIASLRYKIEDQENKIFNLFVAVDSDTDHLPIGPMREHCTPEHLQWADREIDRYLNEARSDIHRACREIIQVYSL